MTILELRERKKELGYTNEKVSELSGVPLGTVQKIFAGVTESPRYETLQALEHVLGRKGSCMMEPQVSYGSRAGRRPGEYTTEDYYALPAEKRAELIDGVMYDMASPSTVHQMIAAELYQALRDCIRSRKGSCIPLVAPLDVCLDRDDRTMLQPDVMVVCDRRKIMPQCVFGAPDFAAEIISDSTRKKDMYLKLEKYACAGVREYWLIDPKRRKVMVYDLAGEELPAIYGFESCVPVGIFGGDCAVDFQEISDYIDFMCAEE